MARKQPAHEIERLRAEAARTRHALAETWTALKESRRRRRRAVAEDAPESRVYAGRKPERPSRHRGFGALMAGAFGLAMVIPRMIRRRSAPPDA
jgi:hypothetical protein